MKCHFVFCNPFCALSSDRVAKVKVLKCMQPISNDEVVLGQYVGNPDGEGEARLGFREDPGCPPDSNQCTFAQAVCWVRNERWDGKVHVVKRICGFSITEFITMLPHY